MTGSELKEWRKTNGYTQNGLAGELEVSRQTIVSWEKSTANKLPRLLELAIKSISLSRNVAGKRAHAKEAKTLRERPSVPGSKSKRMIPNQ